MQSLIRKVRVSRTTGFLFRNRASYAAMKPLNQVTQLPRHFWTTGLRFGMCTSSVPQHKQAIKSSYQGSGYYVQQILTGCLAIYSYYIESGDQCILVDPLFDIQHYNEIIKSRGKKLTGIFISHYHADYVSGQYELQKQHGCKIWMGPKAMTTDTVTSLADKHRITLGKVTLEVWHTPGHTEESSCLVVVDDQGKRDTIFTGDTLFLNEVGRPDLAVKTDLSAADLASLLYDSLAKLKTLNDDLRIYPGHGSGSACGKSIGKGDFCSLGTQKKNNYALKAERRQQFVKQVLDDMPQPPAYFGYNAKLNKYEPFFFEQAAQNLQKALSVDEVYQYTRQKDVVLLDVRDMQQLSQGFIQGSIWIGFDGSFANWVGTLFDPTTQFVIYGSQDQAKDSITRLFRIGYINILGHANFPIGEWKSRSLPISVPQFVEEIVQPDSTVLDVRKPNEWKKDGIVEGAVTFELAQLFKHVDRLDPSKNYITHCRGGYRARIAMTFLLANGFKARAFPTDFFDIFKSGKAKNVKY